MYTVGCNFKSITGVNCMYTRENTKSINLRIVVCINSKTEFKLL